MGIRTKKARELINTLEKGRFYAQCPCCEEPIRLSEVGLFYMDDFTPAAAELYKQKQIELRALVKEFKQTRKGISLKSEAGAKAVNMGFILERIAPTLKTFRFDRNDCRALGDPIDYLIFEGLSKKGEVSRIFFTDIKTGNARLSGGQKKIRELVEKKKVEVEYYNPEKI